MYALQAHEQVRGVLVEGDKGGQQLGTWRGGSAGPSCCTRNGDVTWPRLCLGRLFGWAWASCVYLTCIVSLRSHCWPPWRQSQPRTRILDRTPATSTPLRSLYAADWCLGRRRRGRSILRLLHDRDGQQEPAGHLRSPLPVSGPLLDGNRSSGSSSYREVKTKVHGRLHRECTPLRQQRPRRQTGVSRG